MKQTPAELQAGENRTLSPVPSLPRMTQKTRRNAFLETIAYIGWQARVVCGSEWSNAGKMFSDDIRLRMADA